MNRNQKLVLIIGLVIFITVLMYPPWYYAYKGNRYDRGYSCIASPPSRASRIDFTRLLIPALIVVVLTYVGVVLTKTKH